VKKRMREALKEVAYQNGKFDVQDVVNTRYALKLEVKNKLNLK